MAVAGLRMAFRAVLMVVVQYFGGLAMRFMCGGGMYWVPEPSGLNKASRLPPLHPVGSMDLYGAQIQVRTITDSCNSRGLIARNDSLQWYIC